MNGRSQMQGGKNWILPKEINENRFFRDSHWLEIWKNPLFPGPIGGSVAIDSVHIVQGFRVHFGSGMTHEKESGSEINRSGSTPQILHIQPRIFNEYLAIFYLTASHISPGYSFSK
jgi:hypothetical protein